MVCATPIYEATLTFQLYFLRRIYITDKCVQCVFAERVYAVYITVVALRERERTVYRSCCSRGSARGMYLSRGCLWFGTALGWDS